MRAPWTSPVVFDESGTPRSRRFGDVYHSKNGGFLQARAVFLSGCGLPAAWRGRRRFTVAELGFGLGLNVLALLLLWRDTRAAKARLNVFSVEADPVAADDARRALAAFPELAPLAGRLLAAWPGHGAGLHRCDFPDIGATLDVVVADAGQALQGWLGRADAWFLDGFSPSLNPEMWSAPLMRLVAERSHPGASAATWSVAGPVRRALAGAGFQAARKPGFGAKRERLEARLGGAPRADSPPPAIAIVGAGIAGAALARAFRALGASPRLFERERPGAGASGNPAALVTARLDAGLGPAARLHAQAFRRAVRLFEQEVPGAVLGRGVLQLEATPRDARRFAAVAASDLFDPGALVLRSGAETTERMGEPAPPGLELTSALVIEPAPVLAAWAGGSELADVARIERDGEAWRLADADGRPVAQADVVCLACGAELPKLWPGAPVAPARGQLSRADGVHAPAAAWGLYVAPTRTGVMFGATYDRGDTDAGLRDADDRRNLAALSARFPRLSEQAREALARGRAATRATTADRLPLAGEVSPGLFVLGGLGARGFALAPLLAEHIAALVLGAPSPVAAELAPIVAPERFTARAARRAPVARKRLHINAPTEGP